MFNLFKSKTTQAFYWLEFQFQLNPDGNDYFCSPQTDVNRLKIIGQPDSPFVSCAKITRADIVRPLHLHYKRIIEITVDLCAVWSESNGKQSISLKQANRETELSLSSMSQVFRMLEVSNPTNLGANISHSEFIDMIKFLDCDDFLRAAGNSILRYRKTKANAL